MHDSVRLRGVDTRGTWLDVLDSPTLLSNWRPVEGVDAQIVAITLVEGVFRTDQRSRVEPRSAARFEHHFLVQLAELLLERMLDHLIVLCVFVFARVVDIFAPEVAQSLVAPRH